MFCVVELKLEILEYLILMSVVNNNQSCLPMFSVYFVISCVIVNYGPVCVVIFSSLEDLCKYIISFMLD